MIIIIDGLSPAVTDQTAMSLFQIEAFTSGPNPEARTSLASLTCVKPCQNLWFPSLHRVFHTHNTFSAWAH